MFRSYIHCLNVDFSKLCCPNAYFLAQYLLDSYQACLDIRDSFYIGCFTGFFFKFNDAFISCFIFIDVTTFGWEGKESSKMKSWISYGLVDFVVFKVTNKRI